MWVRVKCDLLITLCACNP